MENNTGYSTFGRRVGYVIGGDIAIAVLAFLKIPILTKGLGASLYGTWSLITATISLVAPLAILGLGQAVVRFLAAEKDRDKVSEDFLSVLATISISGIILSLLLFLSSDYLSSLIFKDIGSAFYIKLASVLVLFNALDGITLAFFRMQLRISLFVALNLGRQFIQVGLILAAVLLGYELTGVIIAVIAGGALFLVINLLIILRQTGLRLPRFSNTKSYLRWSLPLTPNPAIWWIVNVSDRYIISYFLGVAAAGIYSAAYGIADFAIFALASLVTVLYPTIIKSYEEGNISETKNYLKYSLKYFMMIAIPSAFGLAILAEPLLTILTRPEFVAGNTVVPFVAFGAVLYGFFQFCSQILYLANRTHLIMGLLGISAVLNIILNIILIPRLGILGAATATLVAYGVLGIATLIISRRYLKFDLSLPFMLKSAITSAIMVLCIWLFHPASLTGVLISILGGILIYFGVLLMIKGLSKSEINFFLNFARENLRKIFLVS